MEADVEKDMIERKEITLQPTEQSMEDELVSISKKCLTFCIEPQTFFKFLLNHGIIVLQNAAAKEVEATQKKELAILKDLDLTQYEVKGSEHEWKQALSSGSKMISIKG